jgi:hypothetical protein
LLGKLMGCEFERQIGVDTVCKCVAQMSGADLLAREIWVQLS